MDCLFTHHCLSTPDSRLLTPDWFLSLLTVFRLWTLDIGLLLSYSSLITHHRLLGDGPAGKLITALVLSMTRMPFQPMEANMMLSD